MKNKLDDLHTVMKSFQDRAGFTEEFGKMTSVSQFLCSLSHNIVVHVAIRHLFSSDLTLSAGHWRFC